MARNDEFTLERAKPRYLSAPVRSISVTAAYLSTACRLKIPPPLPPTAIIGRRLIYGLIEKNTKFLPPSSARGGNAEALRAREVRLERKNSSYELDLHIETTAEDSSRRVQRKFENELKRSFLSLTRVLDTRR